jgi:hypothetical protein
MHMVRHQIPCEAAHALCGTSLRQHLDVAAAVAMIEEDALLAVAALDNVMRGVRNDESGGSRQDSLHRSLGEANPSCRTLALERLEGQSLGEG